MNLEKEVFDISLNDLIPNRFQPREIFEDDDLKELSESIREHGVIQPIIVRKVGDKYEIIAGERRFRASRMAGKTTIPALVRDIDDREAAKIALLENLQRSNLTPIEEAKTYQTILKIDNITQDELAKSLGKSQSTIANKIRLLSLNDDVQTALLNSQISERHARSLLSLPLNSQSEMLRRVINEKLTVRQLDEEIAKITGKVPVVEQEEITTPISQITPPQIDIPKVMEQEQIKSLEQKELNQVTPTTFENTPPAANINTSFELPKVEPLTPISQTTDQNNISSTAPTFETEQPTKDDFIESLNTQDVKNTVDTELKKEENQNLNAVLESGDNMQENYTRPSNIFDKLRVPSEEREIPVIENENVSEIVNNASASEPILQSQPSNIEQNTNNEIYDLRFAINNFRQAIQNTEKFGFKVKSTEYDSPNKYQFVIEIDKN